MSYRKLKKTYWRRFGCTFIVKVPFVGKVNKKKTKVCTAFIMKKALDANIPFLGITGSRIKDKHHE